MVSGKYNFGKKYFFKYQNKGYYQSEYKTSDYKWANLGIGILSNPNNFPRVFSGDGPAPPHCTMLSLSPSVNWFQTLNYLLPVQEVRGYPDWRHLFCIEKRPQFPNKITLSSQSHYIGISFAFIKWRDRKGNAFIFGTFMYMFMQLL